MRALRHLRRFLASFLVLVLLITPASFAFAEDGALDDGTDTQTTIDNTSEDSGGSDDHDTDDHGATTDDDDADGDHGSADTDHDGSDHDDAAGENGDRDERCHDETRDDGTVERVCKPKPHHDRDRHERCHDETRDDGTVEKVCEPPEHDDRGPHDKCHEVTNADGTVERVCEPPEHEDRGRDCREEIGADGEVIEHCKERKHFEREKKHIRELKPVERVHKEIPHANPLVMVRWGDLDNSYDGEMEEYEVSFDGAKIKKAVAVEGGDEKLSDTSVKTKTGPHFDGVILKVDEDRVGGHDRPRPVEHDQFESAAGEHDDEGDEHHDDEGHDDDHEKKVVMSITIESVSGSVDMTLEFDEKEDLGEYDLGNGHYIEIVALGEIRDDIPDALRERLVEGKLKVAERVADARNEKEELGEECRELYSSLEEYNFLSTDELSEDIDALLAEVKECQKAKSRFDALKPRLRQAKFAAGVIPFKDTDDDEWFYEFVPEVTDIFSGYKDEAGRELGEYRPGNNITMAELLKVASGIGGVEPCAADSATSSYVNVPADHWAIGYFCKVEGIDSDVYADLELDPNRPATRAEVVRALFELSGYELPDEVANMFPDLDSDHPHYAAIVAAGSIEIVSGDGTTGHFNADRSINRAEIAKIVKLFRDWVEQNE